MAFSVVDRNLGRKPNEDKKDGMIQPVCLYHIWPLDITTPTQHACGMRVVCRQRLYTSKDAFINSPAIKIDYKPLDFAPAIAYI